jgi:hypothetical protein
MNLLAKLEPLRRWIDGGDNNDLSDDIASQTRPRRLAEEFLVKVAREIDSVMADEAFTPPGGPTYIPGEFIVFFNREDDKEWQGDKRRGLEQGLVHALRQRAADIFGQSTLNKPAFTIELRVDGTLEKGQFRVKAIWDSETSKTFVVPRKGNPITDAQGISHDSDVTVVSPRLRMVLYSLEVNRNNERLDIIPITKPEITIGRGSQAVEVDVPIMGDAEVSHLHAVLARDAQGNYWLTAKGQNAVFINEHEMGRDVRAQVGPNDKIRICSFELCIRPVANSTN